MHVSRVGCDKWYQSRLSTSSSAGPLPWFGASGRVSMWAGQEGWQAIAQGRTALRGVDCDALESHIDYKEESEWDFM